ncbi:MAG: glycoside hydrolase family 99-like domain-containing protein [Bacteroidia bacterium]
MINEVRLIAFYLPQFHPIPENDEWWGTGFTEWTNVTKAKSLFKGHHQPHIPADLGFYDLRLPQVRKAQADLAKEYGISGFCYWHYWFGNGKRLLEHPFNEVIKSGEPDFPFCLAWANETWSGIWMGSPDKVLIEQQYPGREDFVKHFYHILNALKDRRYIRIKNQPLFLIYRPHSFNSKEFIDIWQNLAIKEGIGKIYFVGVSDHTNPVDYCFDGFVPNSPLPVIQKVLNKKKYQTENIFGKIKKKMNLDKAKPATILYKDFVNEIDRDPLKDGLFPVLLPNWDNTPRSGINGYVIHESSPELFRQHISKTYNSIKHRPAENQIIFLKSWNEWAEGNYMEPDQQFGKQYLEELKNEMENLNKN